MLVIFWCIYITSLTKITKLILVILAYITKHELQNYRNTSNWLIYWYHMLGPPKPYFFRGSSAPIPTLILNTPILWSHKDMMWYIYILWWLWWWWWWWWWWFIYIYIIIIYIYIYVCVFLLLYTCTVGSGSPWVTLDRWRTMRLRRTWWARANRPREPQMGWWKIGSSQTTQAIIRSYVRRNRPWSWWSWWLWSMTEPLTLR